MGKFHLISDERSEEIGKTTVEGLSVVSILKVFAFKTEKVVIWWPRPFYANEGDMMSQLRTEEISICLRYKS